MKENFRTLHVDLHPTKCNLCGGKVIYMQNAKIYGEKFGSGMCYYCTNCNATVGTHESNPEEAYGLLSNAKMKYMRKKCHSLFDTIWQVPQKKFRPSYVRGELYRWLAKQLNIRWEDCHFGYFDLDMLNEARDILIKVQGKRFKVYPKRKKEPHFIERDAQQTNGKGKDNESQKIA